jgi:mannose-6-phosphate isomerase-like protein (cupin superfamily)
VVTGHNGAGKSVVLFDGPATRIIMDRVAELWFTDATPGSNSGKADTTDRPPSMQPPAGGSVFRYVCIPPEGDVASNEALARESLSVLEAEQTRVDVSRHPGMHRTNTIDYIVLLSGEVTMRLDEGDVDLRPFDLVIQRGTNHAWINRGTQPALLLAVNIDATPL